MDGDEEEQRERERARLYARQLVEKEAQRQSIEHQQRWQATRAMLEKEAKKHALSNDAGERRVQEKREEQAQRLRQWRQWSARASTATPAQHHGRTPDFTAPAPIGRSTSPSRREARSPCSSRACQTPKPTSSSRQPPEEGAGRFPLPTANDMEAAVAIQAAARGYAARQALVSERERRNRAATAIQAAVRGERSRRRLAAAVKLQSVFRGWRSREQYYAKLDRIVASEQIQAAFRGWQVRSALVTEAEALLGGESLHELHTEQRHPDAESEAQVALEVALESVRQGLLPRGPEDVAAALAGITVLEERLAELSLQYDRSL